MKQKSVPFIDIFAGPGGLCEGFSQFSAFRKKQINFKNILSIEKDPIACETLRLRSFYRQFKKSDVPDVYYEVIRGEKSVISLEKYPEWQTAIKQVWQAELGIIPEAELHKKIKTVLNGNPNWVLLGGPPCQAYSLVGRSRMSGIGHVGRKSKNIEALRSQRMEQFLSDARHTLYREYLRIVAVHQPAIFVMENVKGILSSKIKSNANNDSFEPVFMKIRKDLTSPWQALKNDPMLDTLLKFRKGPAKNYKLLSFVCAEDKSESLEDRDFLIRSENYGVPQARHRVILLGVREDLESVPALLIKKEQITVRDAIGNMPKLRSGVSKNNDSYELWKKTIFSFLFKVSFSGLSIEQKETMRRILSGKKMPSSRGKNFIRSKVRISASSDLNRWLIDKRLGGIIQHETRSHMVSDLARYLFSAVTAALNRRSPKLNDWPAFLLPAHKNISISRSKKFSAAGFLDRFKVQVWTQPSSTVTCHIAKDGHYYIHPDPYQCRSLTVREAARLQTFPDSYFFCGNRTQQYHQVGNAVPPYLAVQLAEVVASVIKV